MPADSVILCVVHSSDHRIYIYRHSDTCLPGLHAFRSSWDLLVAGPPPVSSAARGTGLGQLPGFSEGVQTLLSNVFAHLHEFPTCT